MRTCSRLFAILCALLFVVSGPMHSASASCDEACAEQTSGEASDHGDQHPCACVCHLGHCATAEFQGLDSPAAITPLANVCEVAERPVEAPPRGIEHPPQLA